MKDHRKLEVLRELEEHACWTRLCQSAAVQPCIRSAQAQHFPDNDGGIGDWPSLGRHEDIRVNLADHTENTTCPLLAGPKIPGCTRRVRLIDEVTAQCYNDFR